MPIAPTILSDNYDQELIERHLTLLRSYRFLPCIFPCHSLGIQTSLGPYLITEVSP